MTTANADLRPSIPVTTSLPEQEPTSYSAAGPSLRRWSRAEYYRLYELGFFDNQRVELIEGTIIQTPAQSNLHAVVIARAARVLGKVFDEQNHWIRQQNTVDLTETSSPDPDLAVVQSSLEHWETSKENPSTALLVVEVSVSTGPYDKGEKASLYAKAGIQDYWVVDVTRKQLQIRRKPAPDETQPFGFGYLDLATLETGDAVSPLALPGAKITVGDLLPG